MTLETPSLGRIPERDPIESRIVRLRGDIVLTPDKPRKLIGKFTRAKLIRIQQWYEEALQQAPGATTVSLLETLPDDRLRRTYVLGVSAIRRLEHREDIHRVRGVRIWRSGPNISIDYDLGLPVPKTI